MPIRWSACCSRRGWASRRRGQPLEDLCEDPIGPRFTVVLAAPDPEIAKYEFEPGSGIRACTRLVRRYVPTR